jgi:hypothetical protein
MQRYPQSITKNCNTEEEKINKKLKTFFFSDGSFERGKGLQVQCVSQRKSMLGLALFHQKMIFWGFLANKNLFLPVLQINKIK